jgi:hypothetical protein
VSDCTTAKDPLLDAVDDGGVSNFQPVTLQHVQNGCDMPAAAGHEVNVRVRTVLMKDTELIADFTPTTAVGSFGLQLACLAHPWHCINFDIRASGDCTLFESRPTGGYEPLAEGVTPSLPVGKSSRVLFRLKGRHVSVFVNGVRLASASTERDPVAGADWFYVDASRTTGGAGAVLQRMLLFAPA